MHKTRITTNIQEQNQTIDSYYKFQSKIYDLTRWTFLFGRHQIVREIPMEKDQAFTLLEVGCGTGYNLKRLAGHFTRAKLMGMDLSGDMLQIAKKSTAAFQDRVELIQAPYGQVPLSCRPDVILFSYSLTMINPQWRELLERAVEDLPEGGIIAVSDFHDSRFSWFKNHMGRHHVRMDGHLLPLLEEQFEPLRSSVKNAYLGIWEYLLFVGRKTN
jgi:S-adenosylmethionine-diacylgycerolhomoserine-N-methlytransferase